MSQLREAAFLAYCDCGTNLSATVRELKALGHVTTQKTLAKWRDEDGWDERLASIYADSHEVSDMEPFTDERLLAEASKQIDRCLASMNTMKRFDPQLSYAFNGLLKTTQELAQRTAAYKRTVFAEFFRDMRAFFREHNPAAAEAIEAESEAYLQYVQNTL